jgi:hypothetical protein
MIKRTPEAVRRFLQLVQAYHGLPTAQFKATQKDASRMVRVLFNADTEEEVEDKIAADRKGAWSLFVVCLEASGDLIGTLSAGPVARLNRENIGRAIPFLTLAVPSHKYG